ncbi:MAG: hypothetical protein ACI9CA_001803 [Natronomonas sp.]|jgi:hypothetical protein
MMADADRPLVRLVVGVCVIPHELGHALPAWLAGLDIEVTVLPAWDGDGTPLARFNAPLESGTPLWLIRLIALAPLPLYLGVAAGAGVVVPSNSLVGFPVLAALSFWAVLSQGDLAVAASPERVRETGEFLAPASPQTATVMLLLSPATVLAVSLLLFW